MTKTATISHITTNVEEQKKAAAQDFWLLYPSATGNGRLAEAMHALYYLPANYKLIVLSNALSRDFAAMSESSLINRVRFENGAGLSNGTSPFSYADAVIYDGADPEAGKAVTPTVVISQDASKDIETNNRNGFTVSASNPEALATAVLRIARAAA
jgi:hypothetical protein